jgi:ceramide synthetase
VYWFKLILNVVHRVLVTGSAEDVRSDDEDEDEDDETSAARAKKNA